ncbi:MAG: DUF4288 domain-containing protein [Armatimonadota bacterium]
MDDTQNIKAGGQWYGFAAKYKSVHVGKPRKRHLWERTFFVIFASDDEHAELVAEKVAKEKEDEYLNMHNETVHWTLMEIEEVKPLFDESISNGTEVYWEFFERFDR